MTTQVSVRTNIRNALTYGLGKIKKTANYQNDLYVLEREVSPEKMLQFPCVDVLWGREQITNNRNSGGDYSSQVRKLSTIYLDVWLKTADDMETARDTILQDIEKFLGVNYYLPDSQSNATCMQCWLESNEPFGYGVNTPYGGVTIAILVEYRQGMTDPTVYV